MPLDTEEHKVDFRVYIGMLVFRWQIIALCFLYALVGGVLYVNLAPKLYQTRCKIMVFRDPNLEVASASSPWRSFSAHAYLLESDALRGRAVQRLKAEFGAEMGGEEKMMLDVQVQTDRRIGATMNISVQNRNSRYAERFLSTLLEEHEAEWNDLQQMASKTAAGTLETELGKLEEKIRGAEDDLIEYQRLHDIARVDAKGSMESAYLSALMGRRNQLTTELMLLEAQYPVMKDANAVVIGNINKLTRETGAVEPVEMEPEGKGDGEGENPRDTGGGAPRMAKPKLPDSLSGEKDGQDQKDSIAGWRDMRVKLAHLQQREKDLSENLKPEHPELKAVRKEIENIQKQLQVGAEIEMGMLKDRHKALEIQLNALEAAEYKWQAKNLLASQRRAELNRVASVVSRFESNYNLLYSRLHDMRVSEELKAEHFKVVEPVGTDPKPVWPDPLKILFMTLAIGLGSGFGLALAAQMLDNRIQSIHDVEDILGVPFLGGVPYWVHSGLEKAIRPIVTEEHSTGAIEAYRALRTSILVALAKVNEKIVLITSADSKEGKTLTALNLAIMVAQMHKKVLLVDMDIRRGRLHRSLGLDREPGVTDALKERKSLKSVIVPTRFENLFLAPTGATVENSAELLQSSDIRGLFVDVQDDYDYIFVDTSPVLRVTDTVIMITHGIGVVVYVARVNRTPKPLVRYSLDMLKEAHILGLILNSIEMHRISSLYYTYQYPNYAYYSNAYAYGYDYYYDYGDPKKGFKKTMHRRGSWEKTRHGIAQWVRRTFLPMD